MSGTQFTVDVNDNGFYVTVADDVTVLEDGSVNFQPGDNDTDDDGIIPALATEHARANASLLGSGRARLDPGRVDRTSRQGTSVPVDRAIGGSVLRMASFR